MIESRRSSAPAVSSGRYLFEVWMRRPVGNCKGKSVGAGAESIGAIVVTKGSTEGAIVAGIVATVLVLSDGAIVVVAVVEGVASLKFLSNGLKSPVLYRVIRPDKLWKVSEEKRRGSKLEDIIGDRSNRFFVSSVCYGKGACGTNLGPPLEGGTNLG